MSVIWSDTMRSLKDRKIGEEATGPGHRRYRTAARSQGLKRRAATLGRLALRIAILAVVVAGPARADNEHAVPGGGVAAKLSYCKDCHGPSAQGYRGYFPIPRL